MVTTLEPQELTLSLYFEHQDKELTGSSIKGFTWRSSFTDSRHDVLSIDLYPGELSYQERLELTALASPITFRVQGRVLLLGRVQDRAIQDDGSIRLQCADYRADLLCDCDPFVSVKQGETLEKALLTIGKAQGITSLEAGFNEFKQAANPSAPGGSKFDTKSTVSERTTKAQEQVLSMMLRYTERSGCTIQQSTSRDRLSLAKPLYDQKPLYFVKRVNTGTDSAFSNVTGSSLNETIQGVHTVYLAKGPNVGVTGQGQTQSTLEAAVFGTGALLPAGKAFDSLVSHIHQGRIPRNSSVQGGKLYRPRYLESKECKTAKELDELVKREISEELQRAYSVTYDFGDLLQTPTDSYPGGLYLPDTTIHVEDEIYGINQDLYVAGVSLQVNSRGGASASVECILPYSFLP